MTETPTKPDATDDGEAQRVEEILNNHEIPPEAMSVAVENGRPVIKIGATRIRFETHYVERDGERSFSTVDDDVSTEYDADGDNVWWTICRDFSEAYVEIDPAVEYPDEAVSADV